jgi:hypothetical protein
MSSLPRDVSAKEEAYNTWKTNNLFVSRQCNFCGILLQLCSQPLSSNVLLIAVVVVIAMLINNATTFSLGGSLVSLYCLFFIFYFLFFF